MTPLSRDFCRRASPIAAVVQFQVTFPSGLGVILVVPLRHGLDDPSYRDEAGDTIPRGSSTLSVAAALAAAGEGELRGDHGREVTEEVWHCEQGTAGDARGDFRYSA